MIILPILLVCITNSQDCQFAVLEPTVHRDACVQQLRNIAIELEKEPSVSMYRATCAIVNKAVLSNIQEVKQ